MSQRLGYCLLAALLILAGCTPTTKVDESARPSSTVVTTLTPADAKFYQDAQANLKKGDTEKAVRSLTRLAQSHPQQLGIWVNLALAHYESGQYKDASEALAHAQKINSHVPEVHNLSGLIAVKQGEYLAAEKNYLMAIQLNNNYSDAHYNLALMYDIFYQDIAKALMYYDRYSTLTNGEDKQTSEWVEELKRTLKRRGEG